MTVLSSPGPLVRLTVAALLIVLQACSSSSPTSTGGGAIALTLSPTAATIQQGSSTQVIGTLTRSGGFTGDVALEFLNAPTGVTGALTTRPINGGSSAVATLSVSNSTPVGTYTVTVRASGTGVATVDAQFALTVSAATPSSYTFTIGGAALSVTQGATASTTLTFSRTNFAGNIALAVDNLPAGVTASFTPNPAPGGSASVTFAATAIAPATTVNVLVRGTAPGLTDVTQPLALTVVAAPGFALAGTPATLSIPQGMAASTGVKATRVGGLTAAISYTASGAPTGLAIAVTPTSTADSSSVTATVAASVPVGSYPVVITGTSGSIVQQTTITVTVTATTRLDYSSCATVSRPLWVASQDGAGAWTRVTGTGDVYNIPVFASGKGAIATVLQPSASTTAFYSTSVQYFTQAELAALNVCPAADPIGKTINGSVTGLSGIDDAEVSIGGSHVFANVPSPNFRLTGVAAGVQDLIGYRRTGNALSQTDRMLIHRDQNIADGGTTGVLDFSAPETFLPATATINLTGPAVNGYFVTMNYLMGASCAADEINFITNSVVPPFVVYGVPASQQRATDYHNLAVRLINGQADLRTMSTSFHTLSNMTLSMGAGIGPVTTSTLPGGYLRFQTMFTLAPDYKSASLTYTTTGTPFIQFIVAQSAAYLGTASTVTLTPPDLSVVAGYQSIWGPTSTGGLSYTVNAASAPPASMCAEGAAFRTASAGTGAT